MTRDDAFAAILARQSTLSAQDLADLTDPALGPDELRELVAGYRDMRGAGPDVWAIVVSVLKECAELAGYVIPLEGAIAGAFGVVTAAKGAP